MDTDNFTIRLKDSHWIKGDKDDPSDLCSHGFVKASIGSEVLCDNNTMDITTSAAALHLMRTLTQDYEPGMFAGQLLPCCGHFIIASDDMLKADAYGCGNGINWYVSHFDGIVMLTSEAGTVAHISFESYKTQIMTFADAVENFYTVSSPKILPDDDSDHNGYLAFWNEWRILRDSLQHTPNPSQRAE